MKWLLRFLFVLATFPFMAFTCTKDEGPDCHQHIDFTNNSPCSIIVVVCNQTRLTPVTEACLSLERYKRIKDYDRWSYSIKAGQTLPVFDVRNSGTCLEYYLKNNDLIFFVLDAQVVAESTPEELVDGHAVMKKFYYTLESIKTIGYTLVYE